MALAYPKPRPLSFWEVCMLLVLTLALALLGAIVLAIEVGKVVRRAVRYSRVRHELSRGTMSPVSSAASLSNCGRSALARPEVRALRPGESRDPPAARVLAFTERLEAEGRYIHELGIDRRMH